MTRTLTLVVGAVLMLASCGQQPGPAPGETASNAAGVPPATSAGAGTTAYGAGLITAVDPAAGSITINHEPIKAVNWPAMTMSFKASPAVIQEAAVGDRVQFDLTVRDGSGEVTAIYPH